MAGCLMAHTSLVAHRGCQLAHAPQRRPLRQQSACHARVQAHAHAAEAACCRRGALAQAALLCTAVLTAGSGAQAAAPPPDHKVLCDQDCVAQLGERESQTLKSGVKITDIRLGTGASPPVGLQVTVNYVAMTGKGVIFDSSLDKGKPYDIRFGTGQVVPGLDEGIKGMKTGGLRRVYVPGKLAFPKGLASSPGMPRIPPASDCIFDVELLYCPGLDDE